ncbi:hypothetical protein N9260_00695 [bacterium]|nr:hypothetical protein [bacterium]
MTIERLEEPVAQIPAINVMAGSRGTEGMRIPILKGALARTPV